MENDWVVRESFPEEMLYELRSEESKEAMPTAE